MTSGVATNIQLLGTPVARGGKKQIPFVPEKRYQLLAYLAYRGEWVSREKLAFLFWPDEGNDMARQNLRQLLTHIRRYEWLEGFETDKHQVRWQVETDVAAFRKASEEQKLDEAVSLYTGPLLVGMETDETVEFSDWLELERERFHSSWREAVFSRANELEEAGRDKEAATLLSRLLREDELDEEALRAYMSAAARAGQVQEALRAYSDFAKRLDRELGMEPTSSTQQLQEKIQELEATSVRVSVLVTPRSAPAAGKVVTPTPLPHSSIPASTTSFVGRDVELGEIAHLLSQPECRLLTLTGPGGIGKTRLALQVARELEASYPDGVYFVALDALISPAAIISSIASVLGTKMGEQDPLEQLLRHLKDKQLLLVLDNFEHLLDGATLVSDILTACPNLKVLATSRERLNLEEEHLLPLEGLAFPEATSRLDEALTYDAVQLFVQRAKRVSPHFTLGEVELPHVLQICQHVQGLPLGLELAAVWVRAMPVADIAREVGQNLDLLNSDSRNLSARHRSVRAAFEYSWRLLSAKEQDALAKLAVFRGGFTREAAAYVADASVAVLAALVDKSLLRLMPSGRYDRHPLLYQFTQEKLAEHPAEQAQVQEKHGRYFHAFLAQQEADENQKGALEKVDEELENIRAALPSLMASPSEDLQRFFELIGMFFGLRGRNQEGKDFFAEVIALAETDPAKGSILGAALIEQAWHYLNLSDYQSSQQLTQRGLELVSFPKDCIPVLLGNNILAGLASDRGDYAEARRLREDLAELIQEAIEKEYLPPHLANRALGANLANLAGIEVALGNYLEAERNLKESLALNQQVGNHYHVVDSLSYLGHVFLLTGRTNDALSYLQESLALARSVGVKGSIYLILSRLAIVHLESGNLEEAHDLAREALQAAKEVKAPIAEVVALLTLGRVMTELKDGSQAEGYVIQGLDAAWTLQDAPTVLNALFGLAKLRLKQEQVQQAATLTNLVLHHSRTEHAVRMQAAQVLNDLRDKLAPEELTRLEQDVAQSLDAVVEELLRHS